MKDNTARTLEDNSDLFTQEETDDNCKAFYEAIDPHVMDPYENLGPVMPGCVVLDEYVGHGGHDYPDTTVVLDPIHPSFRERVGHAWAAVKAVFA